MQNMDCRDIRPWWKRVLIGTKPNRIGEVRAVLKSINRNGGASMVSDYLN
jgi:hypothetical protein